MYIAGDAVESFSGLIHSILRDLEFRTDYLVSKIRDSETPLRNFFRSERACFLTNPSSPAQLAVLCVTVANVIGDLPPGTRRNTYLPPEPTKGGYTYSKPPVQFPKPTPSFPGTRPTPSVPRPTPTYLEPRPTPTYGVPRPTPTYGVPRPTPTYGVPRPTPTSGYPTYTGQPSGTNGNAIEPGVSTREMDTCLFLPE